LQEKTNRGSNVVFLAARNPSVEVLLSLRKAIDDKVIFQKMIREKRHSDGATALHWAALSGSPRLLSHFYRLRVTLNY